MVAAVVLPVLQCFTDGDDRLHDVPGWLMAQRGEQIETPGHLRIEQNDIMQTTGLREGRVMILHVLRFGTENQPTGFGMADDGLEERPARGRSFPATGTPHDEH